MTTAVVFTKTIRADYQKEWVYQKKIALAGRPKSLNCEICGKKCNTVFDSVKEGGKFRGWICRSCDSALGLTNEDISVLKKMINYLEKHNG